MTWYKDGLKFTCQQSGNCCTGAPGYVWVTDEECIAMAKILDFPLEEFLENCTYTYKGKRSLKEYDNGDCIFFDKGCGIYEERPLQCRTWPFWNSLLESPEAWAEEAKDCPGMNKGELHSFEEIEEERVKKPLL